MLPVIDTVNELTRGKCMNTGITMQILILPPEK
jgi:hypothetical protein